MALTISLLNSKGGVGKTTASIYLAIALSRRGYSVEVWDADQQASATEWAEDAAAEGDPLPFVCTPVNVATLKSRASEADVLIIDTPPGEAATQTQAVRRSDVVIIPTAPSLLDVKRVWSTLDALAGSQAIVLVNRANTQAGTYREALEGLEEAGIAVFDTSVKNLEMYKRGASTHPSKLGGFSSVAAELVELMGLKR